MLCHRHPSQGTATLIQVIPSLHLQKLAHASVVDSLLVDILIECIEDSIQTWKISGYPVLIFATTSSPEDVPTKVISTFKHQVLLQVALLSLFMMALLS